MTSKNVTRIIEALGKHEDTSAISVLEELGTNSSNDEIRELTAQALIKRNCHDSLKIVILNKGKGINDLSAKVAMSAINELLNLKDKTEAIKILDDTINLNSIDEVRENAKSVKSLLTLSE